MENKILPKSVMYENDPIYSKLTQVEIDRIYWEKFLICSLIQPKSVIEIGVRTGYSAYAFFQACPDMEYRGVDCSDKTQAGKKEYIEHAKSILKGYNFSILEANSYELDSLGFIERDLISVDGNHTYKYTLHDLDLAYDAVKDGGYILVDDYTYIPTVKEAVDDFILERYENVDYVNFESKRGIVLFQVNKEV